MTDANDPLGPAALDFWLGDWDVDWGTGGGRNRLSRVVGGRGILERFDGRGPRGRLQGMSLSIKDSDDGRWRQTWIDSSGSYLDLLGVEVDGRIAFERESEEDGIKVRRRMVWTDVTTDSMTWRWQASRDGGATWADAWVIGYRRRPVPGATTSAAAARRTRGSAS